MRAIVAALIEGVQIEGVQEGSPTLLGRYPRDAKPLSRTRIQGTLSITPRRNSV